MKLVITEEAENYIKYNNLFKFCLDVDKIQEGCTAIYNPILKVLPNEKSSDLDITTIVESNQIKIFITKEFESIFGKQEQIRVDLTGFFEKIITITNIDAITKNICKL